MSNEERDPMDKPAVDSPATEQVVSDADLARLDEQPTDSDKLARDSVLMDALSGADRDMVRRLVRELVPAGAPLTTGDGDGLSPQRTTRTLYVLAGLNLLFLAVQVVRLLRGRRLRKAS
jgi:hypothetical protein